MPPPNMTTYTWAFGDTGFVLNTDSIGLPFVDIQKVAGLDTAPIRSNVTERQGQDGTYIHTKYQTSRAIIINGTLYSDPSNPETLLDQLRHDYTLDTVRPFYFQLPGQGLRFCNAQGGGIIYDVDTNRRQGLTPIQMTLLAGDPSIYDYPGQSATVSAASISSVGTSFNMAFNVGFGGTIANYGCTVTNYGTHMAYPLVTIAGPITNPMLFDSYNGITMAFNITLAASDQLVIDCRQKSVVLNGTVSRRSSMPGLAWISVPAGVTDTIFFTASAGTGSCTVQLWNTYY